MRKSALYILGVLLCTHVFIKSMSAGRKRPARDLEGELQCKSRFRVGGQKNTSDEDLSDIIVQSDNVSCRLPKEVAQHSYMVQAITICAPETSVIDVSDKIAPSILSRLVPAAHAWYDTSEDDDIEEATYHALSPIFQHDTIVPCMMAAHYLGMADLFKKLASTCRQRLKKGQISYKRVREGVPLAMRCCLSGPFSIRELHKGGILSVGGPDVSALDLSKYCIDSFDGFSDIPGYKYFKSVRLRGRTIEVKGKGEEQLTHKALLRASRVGLGR